LPIRNRSYFNKNKKNISIFISSEDENVAIGDFWKFPFYSDQLDALQQIAKSIELFPESQYDFYIRIHPNLKNINNPYTNKIIGFNHPRFNVILPESTVNSYALIQNSDKVLTFCSTIAAEATFLEKPSIEAGKSFFMNLGSNYLPKDHNDLIKLLKIENLPALPKKGIYMYAYWWVKYGRTARRITDLSGKEVKYNGIKIKGNWLLEGMKWLQRKLK
jgi:capsule polysaccharide export protein KpsC/LpsZ